MSYTSDLASNNSDVLSSAFLSEHSIYSQNKKSQSIIILALAALVFLASLISGVQYAKQKLLIQHANSTGMDWAHQIEAQLPSLSNITGQNPIPDANKLTELVNGMLAVGNIYQIDVINPVCYCYISMGSYTGSQQKPDHVDARFIERKLAELTTKSHLYGKSNIAKKPSKGEIKHIFASSSEHKAVNLSKDAELKLPLNQKTAQKIAKSLGHDIIIHHAVISNQPTTFAEVYHPVLADGKLSYMLRVLVNLEEENATYSLFLYGCTIFALLILIAAFGYPAIKYLKTSAKQKAANARAHHLATHDIMTNISNRNAFQEVVPSMLQHCKDNGKSALLLQFDVNNFKELNDFHGHHVGDKFLRQLAQHLKNHLPENSYVARIGGDEFAAIINGLESKDLSLEKLANVNDLLLFNLEHNGQNIEMSIAAGIAKYPADGDTLEELMCNCDLALYAAKSSSTENLCEYNSKMSSEFRDRLKIRDEFKAAIENSQIVPFYQPLVNMSTGKIAGFEALARWNHPEKGILTPFVFEEFLTDPEIGAALGSLMLNKIIHDMKIWKEKKIPFGYIGLNVGEGDLMQVEFAKNILTRLKENNLSAEHLAIEITETCMFGNNKDDFIRQLEELKSAGCKIALDDFGTGYSSVTQIKELPCSVLKIDKSFVNEVVNDKADQAIIQALLELGNELDFKLVLEGIETEEQLKLLKGLGCHLAQGYFYSRPVPTSDVPSLIKTINKKHDLSKNSALAA